jgi:GT2 family glycosyltransferase
VNPEFSVIVVINNDSPEEELFRCLASFHPQDGNVSFDFIVLDEADEGRGQIYRLRFPWVTFVTVGKMARGSRPRNLALNHARGDYVVFLEDHVTVRSDHLLRLRQIFAAGYDGIGGAVMNGSPESVGAWLQYFCDYHQWLPCRPSGDIGDLPGCNFAYRASTLKKLGAFVESRHKLEWLFNVRAKKQGARLYFASDAPAIHYSHDANTVFQYCRYRFLYGRDFAAHRGLGFWKRMIFALLSPALIGLVLFRIWKNVRLDRSLLTKFWRLSPILLVTVMIWAAGEMCGYLFGPSGPERAQYGG